MYVARELGEPEARLQDTGRHYQWNSVLHGRHRHLLLHGRLGRGRGGVRARLWARAEDELVSSLSNDQQLLYRLARHSSLVLMRYPQTFWPTLLGPVIFLCVLMFLTASFLFRRKITSTIEIYGEVGLSGRQFELIVTKSYFTWWPVLNPT